MNKRLSCALIIAPLILGLCLCACHSLSPSPTPFPTLISVPPSAELPPFLAAVSPRPGSLVVQGEFSPERSYSWALLRLAEISEPGEALQPVSIQERTQLVVDGHILQVEVPSIIEDRLALLVDSSLFYPSLGEHQATIRVRRTSGEMLEFTWRFTVVEELVLPGLPWGLGFVRPVPDTTVSQQAYREEPLVPVDYLPGFADVGGGVCVGILASRVVERGEILTSDEVYDKFHIVALDGIPPGSTAVIEGGYDLGLSEIYEGGRLVTSYEGGEHYKCWRVDLAPGRHEATVRLERASGQVTEFTWWFVITEE